LGGRDAAGGGGEAGAEVGGRASPVEPEFTFSIRFRRDILTHLATHCTHLSRGVRDLIILMVGSGNAQGNPPNRLWSRPVRGTSLS